MEERVLIAETRLAEERSRMEDPSITADAAALQERLEALDQAQREVDQLYERWAELEARLQ